MGVNEPSPVTRSRAHELVLRVVTVVSAGAAGTALTYMTAPIVGRRSWFLLGGAFLINAMLGYVMFVQSVLGWAPEEETARRVVMSRNERIVWITLGVIAIVASAFILPLVDRDAGDGID